MTNQSDAWPPKGRGGKMNIAWLQKAVPTKRNGRTVQKAVATNEFNAQP